MVRPLKIIKRVAHELWSGKNPDLHKPGLPPGVYETHPCPVCGARVELPATGGGAAPGYGPTRIRPFHHEIIAACAAQNGNHGSNAEIPPRQEHAWDWRGRRRT